MVDFYPSIIENLLDRCMEAMTVQKYMSSSNWGRMLDYHRDDNLAVVNTKSNRHDINVQ